MNPELTDEKIKEIYNNVKIPTRATKFSAGYDIVAPYSFSLNPNETILIPTGLRAVFDEGVVLLLFPRSSLGWKYRFWFENVIPVVDADYWQSKNEGHIFAKLTNNSLNKAVMDVAAGDRIFQGVFMPYLTVYGDNVTTQRDGGIGSTNA